MGRRIDSLFDLQGTPSKCPERRETVLGFFFGSLARILVTVGGVMGAYGVYLKFSDQGGSLWAIIGIMLVFFGLVVAIGKLLDKRNFDISGG